MKRLLEYLCGDLRKVQDILMQKLSSSVAENAFPRGVLSNSTSYDSSQSRGRPSLSIDIDTVVFLRSMNFKWIDIARMMGTSLSTLYRKSKEFGVYDLENH